MKKLIRWIRCHLLDQHDHNGVFFMDRSFTTSHCKYCGKEIMKDKLTGEWFATKA